MEDNKKLTILVSSTVYGIEELLERIHYLLINFGYEVWMSHKGTMPVFSDRSAFENCLVATEKCDLFLCLITPCYGSGQDGAEISITHQELRRAIELNKPRWILAHDHVIFARSLLKNMGYVGSESRKNLKLEKNYILDDFRVIDMYEEAIADQLPLNERQGNWVQKYQSDDDAFLFATSQFSRYQEVEEFVKENFRNTSRISEVIKRSNK